MPKNIRWNPKPCLSFQRKGSGFINVVGNEIIQFDANWRVLSRSTATTFFGACQQALILIGATDMLLDTGTYEPEAEEEEVEHGEEG